MSNFENSRPQVSNYYVTQEGTPFTPGDKSSQQRGDGFQNSPQLSQHQGQDRDGSDLSGNVNDRNRDYDDRGREFGNERGSDAFNAERPLNTQPAPEGGVARDGRKGLTEGRAGFGDKLVGKTEKVTGKFTKNPELHEKGEFRESGGRTARLGQARAPHD